MIRPVSLSICSARLFFRVMIVDQMNRVCSVFGLFVAWKMSLCRVVHANSWLSSEQAFLQTQTNYSTDSHSSGKAGSAFQFAFEIEPNIAPPPPQVLLSPAVLRFGMLVLWMIKIQNTVFQGMFASSPAGSLRTSVYDVASAWP